MKIFKTLILGILICLLNNLKTNANVISLNGKWEIGLNRNYDHVSKIPSLLTDPSKMTEGKLWCQRKVELPQGNWKYATLELKGALFSPEVYINGDFVSRKNGGMAPTFHLLMHKKMKPGNQILLEIALNSLKDIPETDASYVPRANHWRSNISSLIWDDIVLHLHGDHYISRLIPFTDLNKREVTVKWELNDIEQNSSHPDKMNCEIKDLDGNTLAESTIEVTDCKGEIRVPLNDRIQLWSPENPNLYNLLLTLTRNKKIVDQKTIYYGAKSFEVRKKQFYLNGEFYPVRAGTVVWHRWIRNPEVEKLAFDTEWFYKNVVQMLKDRGANTLRFHLGNPPEKFIEMCDKHGLLVQYEWSFFHGMPASEKSLLEQWKNWLDLAMKHPSVSLIHPYNESYGEELKTAWSALNKLVKDYPPLVLEERDVIHIHKYWWSLFENVGLYYDSYDQFPKAIMADEFGGNYLDGCGNPGGYPMLIGSFKRFLGRNNTSDMRMVHHTISNSQIAEYWRRIGAAGFSPFCILGSWEDGNHWYVGKIKDGIPKPVWNALTAAWSPQSVSLEIWDRHFEPKQNIDIPVYLFNDYTSSATLNVNISVVDRNEKTILKQRLSEYVPASSKILKKLSIELPSARGEYTMKAHLENPPECVKTPVVSQWDFKIFKAKNPDEMIDIKVGMAEDENELKEFIASHQMTPVDIADKNADVILASRKTWEKIAAKEEKVTETLENAIQTGKSIILLDVGPLFLGQGYPKNSTDLGFLQGVNRIENPEIFDIELIGGIKLSFKEIAEPESHIHPSDKNNELWVHLEKDLTWLWNGLRGGLIVPATEMEFTGLNQSSFTSQWRSRGADEKLIKGDRYFAYELEGFYSFSLEKENREVKNKLREKVKFLVEDAPALAISINPKADMNTINLVKGYKASLKGKAERFIPLVNCGIDLYRAPVVQIDFGNEKGLLIVSQLLTSGRLAKGYGQEGLYGIRYDEVAVQFVMNMLSLVLKSKYSPVPSKNIIQQE